MKMGKRIEVIDIRMKDGENGEMVDNEKEKY